MTNWMTAAGLALIAGGLATLISFRSYLFGGGERRARRRPAIEAPRSRPALAAGPTDPAEVEVEVEADAGSRRGRRGRRRALVSATSSRSTSSAALAESDEADSGSLASIGLADDEEDGEFDLPEAENEPNPEPVRADRYGDRVEGWVRPEYRDSADEPRPGEYWTPIPVDLEPDPEPSAKGYGWPWPVERLPAVPDYEPATGFDLTPVPAEPTEVVPVWPMNDERPGRIHLPRSWATRNDKAEKPPAPARRRPRPRPRPETPETEPPVDRSTMYVSRHAADPPR